MPLREGDTYSIPPLNEAEEVVATNPETVHDPVLNQNPLTMMIIQAKLNTSRHLQKSTYFFFILLI